MGGKGKSGGSKADKGKDEEDSRSLMKKRNRSQSSESPPRRGKGQRLGGFDNASDNSNVKLKKLDKKGLQIEVGGRVDVYGLTGAPQYNGLQGRVMHGKNEKGRFLISVLFKNDVKELALLPENLEPKPSCGWELIASGLKHSTTQEDVSKVFRQFGEVHATKITRYPDCVSKGVALVVMALKRHAEDALDRDGDIKIGDVPIRVQWSSRVKQEMDLPNYFKGQSVIVSGLKSAPQFNDSLGRIQKVRGDGRCEVALQHGSEDKTLALKSENLLDAVEHGRV